MRLRGLCSNNYINNQPLVIVVRRLSNTMLLLLPLKILCADDTGENVL
ncbi:hypothetical protein KP509_09G095700 [Ceratopteris richardii]|uniref:Uncharacterized protein n=1 Tax=Ceratopteris richardii TaxID=49495 RepID=A0A8T2U8X3_CERRI|nr:hypothetical protein KP509_09G095700 [Ceratopteris richardii]